MTDKSDQQQQADKAAQQEADKAAKEQRTSQQRDVPEDIDKGYPPGEYPTEGTFGYSEKTMSEAEAENAPQPEQQSKGK